MESRFASWWYVAIHQGFFVRPFPPSPYYFLSLLFNKRFRIGTLLGSHLKAPPPFHSLPSFVDVGTNGAVGEGWSRALFIGRGKGEGEGEGEGDTSGWKARRQCWKYHICFIGPVLRQHCTRQGALYPVAWETVGAVSSPLPPPPPRGTRVTATRDHDWYSFIMAAPACCSRLPSLVFSCYREESRVTIRITREIFLGLEIFASIS